MISNDIDFVFWIYLTYVNGRVSYDSKKNRQNAKDIHWISEKHICNRYESEICSRYLEYLININLKLWIYITNVSSCISHDSKN